MTEDQEIHLLVSEVKNLSDELGKTPTYFQATKHIKNYRRRIDSIDKKHLDVVSLAGLAPSTRTRKLTNEIFVKDINRHLEDYSPIQSEPRKPWPKIAILGDMHEPFSSDKVKSEFVSFCKSFQPEYIIQMGDSMDMFSHSKYPKSHNVFTPIDEETRAKKNLEEFWRECQKAAPSAKCVGLMGNHNLRPLKMVLQNAPSIEHWAEKYLKDLFTFDNVHMVLDNREEYIISDIAFIHGHLGQLGAHRDYMLMNTVRGHDHVGGCVFRKIHGKILFELDAGFAGDINSKGFTYTNQKMTKTTEGYASICELGPRFIPVY